MMQKVDIAYELSQNGYALLKEPNGFEKILEETYITWEKVFNSETKYKLVRNDFAPYGYISFVFPRGYEMKESFYYNIGKVEPPALAEKITKKIARELILISDIVIGSIEKKLGYNIFTQKNSGNLRIMRYPAFRGEVESKLMCQLAANGSIRSPAHTDLNYLTILPLATAPGLEILNKQSEWISMDSYEGSILIHSGQQLERLTNNIFCATNHRVRNPYFNEETLTRLSMAFFV